MFSLLTDPALQSPARQPLFSLLRTSCGLPVIDNPIAEPRAWRLQAMTHCREARVNSCMPPDEPALIIASIDLDIRWANAQREI